MSEKHLYGELAIINAADGELEIWENCEKEHPYLIHIEHPEYTALCPRSGYPDFGTIVLDYVPGDYIVELKAWKLYINSYRNVRISHEKVVNDIANHIVAKINPLSLRVIGDFTRRGNVKTVITTIRGAAFPFPEYRANVI